jgi:hypothetical protein
VAGALLDGPLDFVFQGSEDVQADAIVTTPDHGNHAWRWMAAADVAAMSRSIVP